MKKHIMFLVFLSALLISVNVFASKLTAADVMLYISRSWTATEVGNPGEKLFPKESREVMIFDQDGSLHMERESSMMGTMTTDAKWEFDESEQNLILIMSMAGQTEKANVDIVELTGEKLVLRTPGKETVYLPSEHVKQIHAEVAEQEAPEPAAAPEPVVVAPSLDPDTWSGELAYNIIITWDDKDNNTEIRTTGVITLEKAGDKKIIKKTESGSTVSCEITGESEIANMIRYSSDCSDKALNGEISFQNGSMVLEIYEPTQMSHIYAVE